MRLRPVPLSVAAAVAAFTVLAGGCQLPLPSHRSSAASGSGATVAGSGPASLCSVGYETALVAAKMGLGWLKRAHHAGYGELLDLGSNHVKANGTSRSWYLSIPTSQGGVLIYYDYVQVVGGQVMPWSGSHHHRRFFGGKPPKNNQSNPFPVPKVDSSAAVATAQRYGIRPDAQGFFSVYLNTAFSDGGRSDYEVVGAKGKAILVDADSGKVYLPSAAGG